MALIKMTPDELRSDAVQYQRSGEMIEDMLRQLDQTHERINANWDGASWQAFDEQYTGLSVKVREFEQLMHDIHKQLTQIADIVERTDDEISQQITRL